MSKKTTAPLVPPTAEELPLLIDRAAVLEREIKEREAELKTIKARIELAVLAAPAKPLQDEDREGVRVPLRGHSYAVSAVVKSDAIIASFRDGDDTHKRLLDLLEVEEVGSDMKAADLLARFFEPPCKHTNRHRDGYKFRQAAAELLSPGTAPQFVAACVQRKSGIARTSVAMTFEPTEAQN